MKHALVSPPFHFPRSYTPTATVRSLDCLGGDSAIRAMPMMISTTDPINSLRAIQCSDPCTAMTAA